MKNLLRLRLTEIFAIDMRSLALFRIVVSAILLTVWINRFPVIEAFYTDEGVYPRSVAMEFNDAMDISIHYMSGQVLVQVALFLLGVLAAIFLLLGYRTRLATFISWFLLISLNTRNLAVNNTSDRLVWAVLFWGLFLPLGACFSVDRFVADRRETSGSNRPERVVSVGSLCLLLQVASVYFFSALAKAQWEEWWNGDAVYYSLTFEQYTRPFGTLLLRAPVVLNFLTHAVFWWEFWGPILLIMPVQTAFFRTVGVIGFWIMHLGIFLSVDVDFFPVVGSAVMIPFLPSSFWQIMEKSCSQWRNGIRIHLEKWLSRYQHRLTYRPIPYRTPRWVQALVACCLVYMLLANAERVGADLPIPASIRSLGNLLQLDQDWSMFCPPGQFFFWFVIPGRLQDGTELNLMNPGSAIRWETPVRVRWKFRNLYWGVFLMGLPSSYVSYYYWGEAYWEEGFEYFAAYVCRDWNRRHDAGKRLEVFDIYLMVQEALPDHRYTEFRRVHVMGYSCAEEPEGL